MKVFSSFVTCAYKSIDKILIDMQISLEIDSLVSDKEEIWFLSCQHIHYDFTFNLFTSFSEHKKRTKREKVRDYLIACVADIETNCQCQALQSQVSSNVPEPEPAGQSS